jgi:hypothetical protein
MPSKRPTRKRKARMAPLTPADRLFIVLAQHLSKFPWQEQKRMLNRAIARLKVLPKQARRGK